MDIACPSCKKTVVLDDAKVPAGPFKIKCPGCSKAIPVVPGGVASATPEAGASPERAQARGAAGFSPDGPREAKDDGGGGSESFSPLEPGSPLWERLKHEVAHQVMWHLGVVKGQDPDDDEDETRRLALVVEDESIFQMAIAEALQALRYRVDTAADKKIALDMLSRKSYDLVTVDNRLPDDPDGGMQILQAINSMPSDQRRRMFVAFISADLSTMDTQSAFILGANLTVSKKDLKRLDKILQQAIKEHDKIYHIFRAVHEELQRQEA